MYIDKMLEHFSIKECNRWYLPILYKIRLFKDMFLKTQIERDIIKMILYILDIRSIIYVVLCAILDVSYILSIVSKYRSNLGEGH